MTDLKKLDIFYSNFLDESLDFWGYTKEFLSYTPDILEYANETHFIHLVTNVLSGGTFVGNTFWSDLQREFIMENRMIIDKLYSYFYNFLCDLNKKLSKDCYSYVPGTYGGIVFSREFFYYWCFSFS
jgi:hypothetical protein